LADQRSAAALPQPATWACQVPKAQAKSASGFCFFFGWKILYEITLECAEIQHPDGIPALSRRRVAMTGSQVWANVNLPVNTLGIV
jgi:hypothetical protein